MLSPDYRPGESDIDLLVEFQPDAPEVLYKTYFSLLNELRQSLNARIDLVMADAITNPSLHQRLDRGEQARDLCSVILAPISTTFSKLQYQ